MVLVPWDVRQPGSNLFPEELPFAPQINQAITLICPLYANFDRFQRDLFQTFNSGALVYNLLTNERAMDRICGSPPALAAPLPSIPLYSGGCTSSGRTRGKVNVGFVNNPVWVDYEEVWTCSNNVGLPVTEPKWVNFTGSLWAWQVMTSTGPGQPLVPFEISGEVSTNDQRLVQVTEVTFNPCPGCNVAPPRILPPGSPPRPPGALPEPRPRFDLDFPVNVNLPGLPAVNIKVPYEVKFGIEFPVQFPGFVLAPRIDISPEFNAYPTFEFNAGGVSISTGGVNIPINNEFTLIQRGSELNCERLLECLGEAPDNECETLTPTVLLSGTSSIDERVFYANFAPGTYRYVSISILGAFPEKQKFYQTNEATGYFGSIAACIDQATYEQVNIFSREAAVNLEGLIANGVRVFLNPKLQFQLIGWKCNE